MSLHRVVTKSAVSVAFSLALVCSALPAQNTGILFGPEVFIRQNGRPVTESRVIDPTGFDPPFTMHALNGDESGNYRVSSAKIWLDEQLLLGPSDFSQQVESVQVPVNLLETTILEVRLASSPGSYLAIWIEGQPHTEREDLEVLLDGANAVSGEATSEQGGTLGAVAPDGTLFSLEIPPGSVSRTTQITMTPILTISNLPFSGGLLWGVDLAPNGLMLLGGATLTITPPSIPSPETMIPLGYEVYGENPYLFPMQIDEGDLLFPITHFSGVLVGSGDDTEAQAFVNQGVPRGEEKYIEEIAKVLKQAGHSTESLTVDQILTMLDALADWFRDVVVPALNQGVECAKTSCKDGMGCAGYAGQAFYSWWASAQFITLGEYDTVESLVLDWQAGALNGFKHAISICDGKCLNAKDHCEKWDIIVGIEGIEAFLQSAGLSDGIDPSSICGGYLENIVHRIDLDPKQKDILIAETISIVLRPKNFNLDEVPLRSDVHEVWWSGSNSVVDVVPSDQAPPQSATVTGVSEGSTAVAAFLRECESWGVAKGSANIRVGCPVASVEISPSSVRVDPGDSAMLELTLRDQNGAPITSGNLIPDWSAEPHDVISLSPGGTPEAGLFATVTGGATEGVATVTASICEEQAQAQVEVKEDDIRHVSWSASVSDSHSWTDVGGWITIGTTFNVSASWTGSGAYSVADSQMLSASTSGSVQQSFVRHVSYDCGGGITRSYTETENHNLTLTGAASQYLKDNLDIYIVTFGGWPYLNDFWQIFARNLPSHYSWTRNASGSTCSGPYSASSGDEGDTDGFWFVLGYPGHVPAEDPEGTSFSFSGPSAAFVMGGGEPDQQKWIYANWTVTASVED